MNLGIYELFETYQSYWNNKKIKLTKRKTIATKIKNCIVGCKSKY